MEDLEAREYIVEESEDEVDEVNRSRRFVLNILMLTHDARVDDLFHISLPDISPREMDRILQDFWMTFERVYMQDPNNSVEDVFILYMLRRIYESIDPPLSHVSKMICAYLKVFGPSSVLQQLLQDSAEYMDVTDMDLSEFLELLNGGVLPDMLWVTERLSNLILCTMDSGQYGLLLYMVQFRHIPFIAETANNLQTMASNFIFWRRLALGDNVDMRQVFVMPDEEYNILLERMQHSAEFSFRRIVLILFTINMLTEHQVGEQKKSEILIDRCRLKVKCLKTFTMTTTEPFITWIDIEKFLIAFFNETPESVIFRRLQESLKSLNKLSRESLGYPNPRSLKDLVRCKIRECLQDSVTLPNQLPELNIPSVLEKYILFYDDCFEDSAKTDSRLSYLNRLVENQTPRQGGNT